MLKLISLILILCILIFLIFYKKEYILNKLKNKKLSLNQKIKKNNVKQFKYNLINADFNDIRNYSNINKSILRKEMIGLFKSSKENKIKALKIAEFLSDKSILPILKLGLKDMDSDIVKISATLIQKFK